MSSDPSFLPATTASRRAPPRFFQLMALFCAAIVLVGFAPSFYLRRCRIVRPCPSLSSCKGWFAVILRRHPEAHKRLMLLATLSIIAPAIGRMPLPPMAKFALPMVAVVGCMAFDLVRRRRIHPAFAAAANPSSSP